MIDRSGAVGSQIEHLVPGLPQVGGNLLLERETGTIRRDCQVPLTCPIKLSRGQQRYPR